MKLKSLKQKPIYALALVLCMIAPMLMAISPVSAAGTPTGVFSAVESGTTNVNSISLPSSPIPINTSVSIDIRIDNASNIWGWTIPTVSWNASVLQLTGVTEGPFLADNTGPDSPTFFVGNSKALWDNTNGDIMGGLSEAIQTEDTSTDPSGVVATLTFNVTGYGNSPVIIAGGNLIANSSSYTTGVNVTCNNASVTVPPVDDVAVASVYSLDVPWDSSGIPKTVVCLGCSSTVNVTAADPGTYTETFNVTVYANTTIIASQNVTLSSLTSTNLAFTWNTTGLAYGNYTISAYASPVPGQTDTANNNCTGGWVFVSGVGDISNPSLTAAPDGVVNIWDLLYCARAYMTTPGMPGWNPNADITSPTAYGVPAGQVTIWDLLAIAKHYMQTYTY